MRQDVQFIRCVILVIIILGLSFNPAMAAELNLEVQFSNPLTETTAVVVAAFSGLIPVYLTEVVPQSTSMVINVEALEVREFKLFIVSALKVMDFDFVLQEDSSIIFKASSLLQQDGNKVIITQ